MLRISSCDSQGSVYVGDSVVYRPINANRAGDVEDILRVIGTEIEGVIETSVCAKESLPAELKEHGALTLQHRKVAYISYPHEWCATMLQDAAIFHLTLSEQLLAKGLALKDAHPWNILFDYGRPVFVDFTSIVTEQGLFAEEYLEASRQFGDVPNASRTAMLVREIFARMFQPYFLNPLLFYACGERDRVRPRIANTTLNAATDAIGIRECLPRRRIGRSTVKKILRFLKARISEKRAYSKLGKSPGSLGSFYADMRRHVQGLAVAVGPSAYSAYYSQKGEDQDWSYSENWNEKQKAVHDALNSSDIHSVLDVACNTGWFALMAEKLGKNVAAFDNDEGCIETLYVQVRRARLNILPLVMDFTYLTQDRYSIHDGNKVLINAMQRLRSDAVIALGVIHHLVLGLGMRFEDVLESLIRLCRERLVIEFIDLNDAMIQNETSFFPAYFNNRETFAGYDMQTLIGLIEARGFDVTVRASHPETRKILVCDRRGRAWKKH
jgi:SAM-dependent methyltransferase